MSTNPHHAVPEPLTQPPPAATDPAVTASATVTATAGGLVQLGGAEDVVLVLFVSVAGLLASLALMILAAAITGKVGVVRAGGRRVGGGGPPRLGSYVYRGGRASLRRVYIALRSRLASRGAGLPPGATASEVARTAVDAGLLDEASSQEFSRLYNFFMYSRVEPGPGDVERVAELAGVGDAVERRG